MKTTLKKSKKFVKPVFFFNLVVEKRFSFEFLKPLRLPKALFRSNFYTKTIEKKLCKSRR